MLADHDAETPQLYQFALLNFRPSEPSMAIDLFEATWSRRDEHEEESGELSFARAAGVALAAHAELFDDWEGPTAADILAELDPEDLYDPEVVVYEQLTGGDPETDSEDLFARTEEYREEDETFAALEAQAFGTLLKGLE